VTHNRRRPARGVLPALCLLTLAACSRSQGPVLIGLAGPFTDSVGAPMLRAAELAVREINQAGGIAGRPLELLSRDDYGDPDSAVGVATALESAGVVAVVGHVYSGTTLAAAPVYNGAPHPVVEISPSSTSPAVSAAGPYTFRVVPSDIQQGAALARFAAQRLRLKTGTLLYLNDEYGRGLRRTFTEEFARLGGTIDESSPYLGDDPDVSAYLDRMVRQKTSQFVFVGGNLSEAVAVLRQLRARGVQVPLLGGDALEGIEDAGALAEGTYLSNGYLPSTATQINQKFVAAYASAYPGSRPPNQPAAATYDIIYLLRDVISRSGTERQAIRDDLSRIGRTEPRFEGVTGGISFDTAGDLLRQGVLVGLVEHGHVRAVEGF